MTSESSAVERIETVAKMGTFEEFAETFAPGDDKKSFGGRPLLIPAAANKDLAARYAILAFLVEHGADASATNDHGENVLHVLLGQKKNDISATADICRKLIDAGADVNALDDNQRLPIQALLNFTEADDALAPLYDLWFEQPALDFLTPNAWGFSPLELARKVPYRASLVGRMRAHLDA